MLDKSHMYCTSHNGSSASLAMVFKLDDTMIIHKHVSLITEPWISTKRLKPLLVDKLLRVSNQASLHKSSNIDWCDFLRKFQSNNNDKNSPQRTHCLLELWQHWIKIQFVLHTSDMPLLNSDLQRIYLQTVWQTDRARPYCLLYSLLVSAFTAGTSAFTAGTGMSWSCQDGKFVSHLRSTALTRWRNSLLLWCLQVQQGNYQYYHHNY